MNQNHWDHDNDTNQNDCCEHTSTSMTTDRYKTKKRVGRIVAIVLMCAVLCFGAGALGTIVMYAVQDPADADLGWNGDDILSPSLN